LKACAEGKPLPNAPTLDEGLEIANSKPTSYSNQTFFQQILITLKIPITSLVLVLPQIKSE